MFVTVRARESSGEKVWGGAPKKSHVSLKLHELELTAWLQADAKSRDKVRWANIAKNKSKKIEGNENKKKEDEATRAMREDSEVLRRENAELKATVNKMSKEIEDIKKMLATRTTPGTKTPKWHPAGPAWAPEAVRQRPPRRRDRQPRSGRSRVHGTVR
ncbi:hypothetical protein HPB48_001686 [Haemaphysalis longicornis]|uniref:Uncharacterized protein n=1 Tax=Haemaphysalis longicornis TaxID=44386 RepID=A0A9J6GL63_HAELO|nr:hypothetical protein HPB48_001686 [Haemaphysalis longicornis]